MSVGALFYRNVTRRFSTLFLAVTVGAYVSNYAFNGVTDFYWDTVNRGKQWHEVKARLELQ